MAKKDFGRRLMPEYLLKYAEELQKNHPDPSASWGGGGGGDYTAGEGIEISDQDVISIDEEVVAKKTDIPDVSDFVTDTDLNTVLADYELKSEAFSGSYNDLTDKPTLATVATTGDYDDLLNKPTIPDTTNMVTTNTAQTISGKKTFTDVIKIDRILGGSHLEIRNSTDLVGFIGGNRSFELPINKPASSLPYTLATTDDIPTVPSVLSAFTNDVGYITGITSADVTTALGYTPGTSNFSGSYNDLTNKPTIPTKTSDLQNDSGFITGVTWNDVTGKPTFATVATSGSYNDLSDKPTIPDTSNFVTTNTNQTITGTKTFTNGILETDNLNSGSGDTHMFTATIYADEIHIGHLFGGTNIHLLYPSKANGSYTLATLDDIPSLSGYATETWVGQQGYLTSVSWNDVLNKPTFATVATSGSYNDLTDKPTIPTVNDATITFTQGGTTKGTITLNQSTNQTIALDAGGGSSAPYEITNMVVDSTNQTITLTITANE